MQVLTQELGRRLEAAEAAMCASEISQLAALPGNPYGAEVRRFGNAVALTVAQVPTAHLYNRILCAGPEDEADLQEAVAFMRSRGLRPRVDVSPLHRTSAFMQHLFEWGLAPLGFEAVLFTAARPMEVEATVDIAHSSADIETAADILVTAFGSSGRTAEMFRDIIRTTANHPAHRLYLARVDGEPAGAAELHVEAGVGSLEVAGTLPAFRGRGAQSALLRRRIADAAALGCDLVVSQTASGSTSQANMERAGLRVAYTKAEYYGIK